MIISMTGYGRASLEEEHFFCQVEIRSVNNRFLKASIRLPDELAECEADIDKLVRQQLCRGSINVTVTVVLPSGTAAPVNREAAQYYLKEMQDLARGAKDSAAADMTIDLTQLLQLPGVCESPNRGLAEPEHQHRRDAINRLTADALAQVVQMRKREGEALWKDLKTHLDEISKALESIRQQAPQIAQQYHQRLRARVMQLVGDAKLSLSDSDLLREVALFSERADISEEISRLSGHLEHFLALAEKENQVGRTLEFIAQEMLREANTIGSKASDGQIAKLSMHIKGIIDRIKEQVQNVE
ncbi:MAG: YicC/YloC family endoribonuclease [Phycisphaerae bacterium]